MEITRNKYNPVPTNSQIISLRFFIDYMCNVATYKAVKRIIISSFFQYIFFEKKLKQFY